MCDYGCSIDVRHSIQNFTNKHCCVIQAACLWIYDQQMIVHELKSFLRLIFNVSLHENTAVVNWLCSSHSCLKYWPSQWRHLTLEPLWRLQKWSKVIRVGPKKVAIAIWDEMPQRRLWSWTLTSITVKKILLKLFSQWYLMSQPWKNNITLCPFIYLLSVVSWCPS